MRFERLARLPALLLGIALLAVGGAEVHAQEATAHRDTLRRTWARAGGGLGTFGEGNAIAFNLSLQHQRAAHLFSGRLTATSLLFGPAWRDAGLLYGRAYAWSWGHASASVGAAYTWSQDASDDVQTLGVPVQAQVYVAVPYLPLGLTLGGFGNVNAKRLFGGISAGFVLGDLR